MARRLSYAAQPPAVSSGSILALRTVAGRGPGCSVLSFSLESDRRATIEDILFNRSIEVDAFDEGENMRIVGRLLDKRLGEPLHGLEVEMIVTVFDGVIKDVSGSMPTWPMEECKQGIESLQELIGAKIAPGFSDFVRRTVGSNRGCTHLAALVMNIGNTCIQGRGAYLRKHVPDNAERDRAMAQSAQELGLLDGCVSWREDGPIVRRWREEHPEGDPKY